MPDPLRVRLPPAVGLVLLAAGCVPKASPPAVMPPVSLAATTFVGTPLGDVRRPATAPSPAAVGLDVTWVALAAMPAYSLLPLDAQASLTTSPMSGAAVLTTGRQTATARFGTAGPAADLLSRLQARRDGPVRQLGHQAAVLDAGNTVRLRCDVAGKSLTLTLARPADTTPSTAPATTSVAATTAPAVRGSVTVSLRGFTPDGDAAPVDAVETAWLDEQDLSRGNRLALLVPCDFKAGPWKAIGVYVELTDADALVTAAATRPATRPATTQPTGQRLALASAIESLKAGGDARPPLLFLAGSTGATVAADAILVADATLLAAVRDAVLVDAAAVPADAPAADVGWAIDRATLLTLCAVAEKNALPPEAAAVLGVHAGEVGRRPDALAELVRGVGNAADLRSRLVGENYIALEDPSPAARVRAYDWLKSVGRAPADYDPLAAARDRRRAINKALDPNGNAQ